MIHPKEEPGSSPTPPREKEGIRWGLVGLIAIVSLGVFTLGGGWAAWILAKPDGRLTMRSTSAPPELGQDEIGIVNQRLFEEGASATPLRQAQRKRLGSYGWVDREKGLIHMPIERAMQLVAEGRR